MAQPHARTVKVCPEGTVKSPANKLMTKSPKDDTIKGATAMSSKKTV
jgi:hypothetical protein